MQEILRIVTLEDRDGKIQLSVAAAVDLLHHHHRDVLVRDAVYERIFQHMRERSVPDVVHQDSSLHSLSLRVEDEMSLLLQRQHCLSHQVEGPQRMLEPRMTGTWIDNRGQTQLVDSVKTLKQRMLYDIIEQSAWNLDKPEYRVVDDFGFFHTAKVLLFFEFTASD